MSFAAGTSELTTLLQNYDQENATLHEKVYQLNKLYKECALPLKLYEEIKQSMKY